MNDDIFWQVVLDNDDRFDGTFFLGVKTTGIYCRPSCRARSPKRENVAFYRTWPDAEDSGLRACLRCKPREPQFRDPAVEKVLAACEILDSGQDGVSLEALAAEVGTSPSHLQRTFKAIIGVSPRKYSEIKRMERFRAELRAGSDVAAAVYDAGFGSSSRVYEKAASGMGMTPASYKKGGRGMEIGYTIVECELGRMLVARTVKGICKVSFGDGDEDLIADLHAEYPNARIEEDSGGLKDSADAIVRHIAGDPRKLELPVDVQATAFQMRVWELLRQIPYGETITYSELAERMGDKNKVRAVAQACGRNRVAVVIPCHRVVGKSGRLTGYRWGTERKERLLSKERKD